MIARVLLALGVFAVTLVPVASCNAPQEQAPACSLTASTNPALKLTAIGGVGVLLVTSSTTNTVSSSGYVDASSSSVRVTDGSADSSASYTGTTGSASGASSTDASVTSSAIQTPTPVAVAFQLVAQFQCPVEGDVHATITTSVGQFSNGLPATSAAGGGSDAGTAASTGTSGVAGTSVTVLLGTVGDDAGSDATVGGPEKAVASDGGDAGSDSGLTSGPSIVAPPAPAPAGLVNVLSNTLYGYATVQLTTDRTAYIQAVVGDTTVCGQLIVDGTLNPWPAPNSTVVARLVPCDVLAAPIFDPPPPSVADDAAEGVSP